MSDPPVEEKKPMTQEERLQLCQKMDEELDEFINSLERKRYTDGWPEDRWEEEMDKHPFFMKSTPENGEMSPLAEGLAKLKYDPDENTPAELASNYKEDGNFNFKHKNYRLAILGYTEGIKIRCNDPEVESSLYNNRAAAHWFLKNYRSALYDSEKALSFNPAHSKARLRAIKSAIAVNKYDTALDHCHAYLQNHPNDTDVMELKKEASRKKLLQERDLRKRQTIENKNEKHKTDIVKAIVERGIKVSNCEDEEDIELGMLEPCLPGAQDGMVHIQDGILQWPVLFLYPEKQMTDFIKGCPENVPVLNQIQQLFPAPWDTDNAYYVDRVNVYYEGYDKMPHVIDVKKNLGDLLVEKYFELKAGTPAFFILPRGSKVERSFLESFL